MYLTYYYEEHRQINAIKLLELMYGQRESYDAIEHVPYGANYRQTRTISVETLDHMPYDTVYINQQAALLARRCNEFLQNINNDTSICYEEFRIPKHSGGFRTIHAPNFPIASLQRDIINFMKHVLKSVEHNNAFAYVTGRSTKDAIIRHKNNKSRWFLKLDLKDFFPNCNKEFIINQLNKIYPYNLISSEALSPIIDVCLLNDGLPQGAPTSPMITNLIMLPIDYKLNKELFNFNKSHYCVTRYADDILISNKFNFKYTDVLALVQRILVEEQVPFTINNSKTRYASNAGRNWNLGLMYNHKGDITVGHARKKKVKNMLYYFFRDNHERITWELGECQQVLGELAYVHQIEPNVLNNHVRKLEVRYNKTLRCIKKEIFSNNH